MSYRLAAAVSVLVLSVALVPANGANAMISVDPDAFAAGTDISNAFAGITLSSVFAADNAVYSNTNIYASTGNRTFAHDVGNTTWGDGIWEYLRADFASGASSVSLDFIGDNGSDLNGVLAAYDAANNLVAADFTVGVMTAGDVQTLTVSDPNIAFVLALGNPVGDINDITTLTSGGPDAFVLDNMMVEVVPEPATVGLLGLGLCLVGLAARRRLTR